MAEMLTATPTAMDDDKGDVIWQGWPVARSRFGYSGSVMLRLLRAWADTRHRVIVVFGVLLLLVLSVLLAFVMPGHDLGPLGGGAVWKSTVAVYGPTGPLFRRVGSVECVKRGPNWALFGASLAALLL